MDVASVLLDGTQRPGLFGFPRSETAYWSRLHGSEGTSKTKEKLSE